jgi:anti-sigma factor RsiW
MHCDEAQQLISAGIDGEISDTSADKLREHTETCANCTGVQADFRRISQQLKIAGREVLPSRLEPRVRDAIARTARESYVPALTRKPWLRQVAAMAAVCLIAIFGTWTMTRQYDSQSRIERDVLAAHMRALLQDNPIQVASSDTHTVKPWFNGRVEFSPDVKDFAAEGFPLAGGRLDYIGGKRVAALVYRHRLHVIDVFVWPAATAEDIPPRLVSTDGYNLLTWSHGGLTYWAVSDLNATELRQFKALL